MASTNVICNDGVDGRYSFCINDFMDDYEIGDNSTLAKELKR